MICTRKLFFLTSVIFSWSENRSFQSLLKFLNYYNMLFINLKLVGWKMYDINILKTNIPYGISTSNSTYFNDIVADVRTHRWVWKRNAVVEFVNNSVQRAVHLGYVLLLINLLEPEFYI